MLNRLNKEALTAKVVTESTTAPDAVLVTSEGYLPNLAGILKKLRRAYLSFYLLGLGVIAILAITIAYQFHPTIYMHFGGGYDAPFLDGFGDEVRPAQASPNDNEQTDSTLTQTDPTAGQRKFLPEPTPQSYRWTKARSIVLLPGVGAYPSRLTVRAAGSPFYPQGQQVQILLNGQDFKSFELKPGNPVELRFEFGAERFQSGNMAIELRVTNLGAPNRQLQDAIYQQTLLDATDSKGKTNLDLAERLYKRELDNYSNGFKLYGLWLEPQAGASGFAMPDIRVLLTLTVSILLFFGILSYSGLARVWAFGIASGLVLLFAALLAAWRLEITPSATRFMLVFITAAVALPLLDWVIPKLFKHWQLPLPQGALQGLLLMFVVGMLLRGGGVLYHQTVIIDEPYHLERINRVLDEPGGIGRLYSSKEDSKVPGHWSSSAIIPYSPFTYFYLAPLAALPLERAISINLFMAFLDAVRVFVVFGLAVVLGFGVRAALAGAGLYLLMPLTWLLNSWGNWPTTLSLWLAVLYIFLALVYFRKLDKPIIFISLTLLLTITNLDYSVTMVFMGMLLYGWGLGLVIFGGRKDKQLRQSGWLILASATSAAIAAIALYYYQFIPDIATTLTSFGSSFGEGEGLGLDSRGFFEYLGIYAKNLFVTYSIGLYLLVALVVLGVMLIYRGHKLTPTTTPATAMRERLNASSPTQKPLAVEAVWLIGVWLLLFSLWGLVQWKIDMVDKHVWWTTPLLVGLAGVGLVWAWEQLKAPVVRYATQLVISGTTLWLTYAAASLWIYRIFFKRH